MRPSLEVADIFRSAGPAYRVAHAGHLGLHQLKVMSAIEHCRTAASGGHVEACADCGHWRIAYDSCRNRHCPRCQGAAARAWLAEREADLLPVGYFHVVFTLPAQVADLAFHNKALVYDLLFRAASETMLTIAADPKRLGVRIGITAVLHTWGSAMTHHPHVHMIVPGGGIAPGGAQWISSRPAFLLLVRVLGALFAFFGSMASLADRRSFVRHLSPVRKKRWVVYAKAPFAGHEAVLAYMSRHTHRVAISNSRLIAFDKAGVTFRYMDYRRDGAERQQVMTSPPTSSSAASCSTSCRAGSTVSDTMACSRCPRARPASISPASCSPSRRRPMRTYRKNRPTHVSHARAAAATWSSSRPSSAGLSHGRRHPIPRPTGTARHQPAWLIRAIRPGNRASDDDAPRPVRHHRRCRCLAWPFTTME